jgi:hypothetical protein
MWVMVSQECSSWGRKGVGHGVERGTPLAGRKERWGSRFPDGGGRLPGDPRTGEVGMRGGTRLRFWIGYTRHKKGFEKRSRTRFTVGHILTGGGSKARRGD